MKKQSILCCLLACILLPVFAQETDTSVPEAAVPAEKPQTSEISSKDEKKFGITPALMLSAWGIEPAVSVQIFRGEAEISVPVTVSMENKAGVGVTAGLGFNSNPFNEGVCHQQHHRLNDRCGQQNINTQRVLPFRLPVGSGFRCFCKILPTLGRLVWRHHTHQF